jgi:citrate lyase subunit beta/citryl-CoA lyase
MNPSWPIWRSMLFVPSHEEKFVEAAHTRGADAYILDLEDSVPLAKKSAARGSLARASGLVARSSAAVVCASTASRRWLTTICRLPSSPASPR